MARREGFVSWFRGPGSSMESQARDITAFPTCLTSEVMVKVKEKQNRPAFPELR